MDNLNAVLDEAKQHLKTEDLVIANLVLQAVIDDLKVRYSDYHRIINSQEYLKFTKYRQRALQEMRAEVEFTIKELQAAMGRLKG